MAAIPATAASPGDDRRLAGDVQATQRLAGQAGRDPKASARQAALQFESLFMQQVLKGLRASTHSSGMLDNAGGDLAKSMLDDQMAKQMSGRRGGLAEVVERQLKRQLELAEKAKAAQAPTPAGLPLQRDGEAKAFQLAPSERSLSLDASNSPAARVRGLLGGQELQAPQASRAAWAAGPAAAETAARVQASLSQAAVLQAMDAATAEDPQARADALTARVSDGVDSLLKQLETSSWSLPAATGQEAGGARVVERPADVGTVVNGVKGRPEGIPQKGAAGFIQQHSAAAADVAARTGIPAQFMISQAALETGWGRKEILRADGSTSHNLFGIKADANWKGPTADVTTTEYINGQPQRVTARFRAYSSYAESFADYAKLLTTSPRYQGVVQQAKAGNWAGATASARGAAAAAEGFAVGLQKAGYATDPAYATKLAGVINTTLRLQRAMG